MTRGIFLYQTAFSFDRHLLCIYKEVLEGSHWDTFKLAKAKHEHRTEHQSI